MDRNPNLPQNGDNQGVENAQIVDNENEPMNYENLDLQNIDELGMNYQDDMGEEEYQGDMGEEQYQGDMGEEEFQGDMGEEEYQDQEKDIEQFNENVNENDIDGEYEINLNEINNHNMEDGANEIDNEDPNALNGRNGNIPF